MLSLATQQWSVTETDKPNYDSIYHTYIKCHAAEIIFKGSKLPKELKL